jgi:translation elongation factor EF-Tu-like GTPase
MPLKKKKTTPKKKKSTTKPTHKKPAKKTAPKKPAQAKPVKRTAPKRAQKTASKKPSESNVIGKVTHYFPHVNAAVVKLSAPLKIGDAIRIKGHTTDFTETVTSIQINRVPINAAKKGDEIGLLVSSRVRGGDKVYKANT